MVFKRIAKTVVLVIAVTTMIGAGAGIIFKGTGFYCTDYPKPKKPGE